MDVELNEDALAPLDLTRLYVRRNAGITTDDDLLKDGINAYSKAIARYTKREFMPAVDNTARDFGYDGDGQLSLAPYEARTIRAITAKAVGATQPFNLLADVDYLGRPTGKTTEGTYLDVHFTTSYRGLAVPSNRWLDPSLDNGFVVTVTADWGAGLVPDDVRRALLIAVAANFRNPEAAAARSVGEFSFTAMTDVGTDIDSGQSLPRASRALLKPFRRPRPLVRSVRARSESHYRRPLPFA